MTVLWHKEAEMTKTKTKTAKPLTREEAELAHRQCMREEYRPSASQQYYAQLFQRQLDDRWNEWDDLCKAVEG